MAFYEDMAGVVADLLKPDALGGLGQGAIQIARETAGTPDPMRPFDPIAPTLTKVAVDQVGSLEAEYTAGGTVISTDAAYMIAPPATITPKVGDRIFIGAADAGGIVHVERLGSIGVPVYFKIYVNR